MKVRVNKNEKVVEWNVGEKIITIYNEHVLYAFKHGKNMLMIKEKHDTLGIGFSTYDIEGGLVFSYKYMGNCVTFRGVDIDIMNGAIISADYEEEKEKLVILIDKGKIRSLLIYDEQGDFISEIVSPIDYTFVSLKNNAGKIIVVAQGTNDTTRDLFGRNDWDFVIDFENFYVEKKSITQ